MGLFSTSLNASKFATALKLCLGRIKLVQNKKTEQIKIMRREIAEKLQTNQIESARIRAEGTIRETSILRVLEIVELFIELLSVRVRLVEKERDVPVDMREAVASVIFCAPRLSTEIPELSKVCAHLATKYGRDFAAACQSEAPGAAEPRSAKKKLPVEARTWVNAKVESYLTHAAPSKERKMEELRSIAAQFHVEFDEEAVEANFTPPPAQAMRDALADIIGAQGGDGESDAPELPAKGSAASQEAATQAAREAAQAANEAARAARSAAAALEQTHATMRAAAAHQSNGEPYYPPVGPSAGYDEPALGQPVHGGPKAYYDTWGDAATPQPASRGVEYEPEGKPGHVAAAGGVAEGHAVASAPQADDSDSAHLPEVPQSPPESAHVTPKSAAAPTDGGDGAAPAGDSHSSPLDVSGLQDSATEWGTPGGAGGAAEGGGPAAPEEGGSGADEDLRDRLAKLQRPGGDAPDA
ncbi:unnamed protein product [Pedinophyceae sp. YPF-701]|nr:unnamed protein product [Pedinophyceae sp. YPF-701]